MSAELYFSTEQIKIFPVRFDFKRWLTQRTNAERIQAGPTAFPVHSFRIDNGKGKRKTKQLCEK